MRGPTGGGGSEPSGRAPPFLEAVNPELLGPPRGWTNGFVAPAGARTLVVAGQTATGREGAVTERDFATQFDIVLEKVLRVVEEAGGRPEHLARLTVYVTDLDAYRAARKAIGTLWRARLGRHFPAMALVEVRGLVDEGALVEMEATAFLPPDPG